jgi:hypothetical protein
MHNLSSTGKITDQIKEMHDYRSVGCWLSQRRSGSLLVSHKGTAAEYGYTPPAEHLHLAQISSTLLYSTLLVRSLKS